MASEQESKHRVTLFIVSGILLLLGLVYFVMTNDEVPEPVACTKDAMICPDGSAVGRIAPNCDFAPCPTEESAWQEVVRAIESCEVESVSQTHSRDVSITYKDGRELNAVEPQIDDIIDLAVQAEGNCGRIIMMTE